MTYRVLFLGDVVGKPGRIAVRQCVPSLLEIHQPLFLIINGENAAAGIGLTPDIAEEFFGLGAHAVTLGNHSFNRRELIPYIEKEPRLVRPDNYPPGTPGRSMTVLERDGVTLTVANLCGQTFMESYGSPWISADRIVENARGHLFVDFHAETTSEKIAMAWYLDGKASAVVGTHTHVQTADERILPGGTAAITDVGMCGPENGVIGMDREIVMKRFLTLMPHRFEVADGPGVIHGVVIDIERESGHAVAIERVRFQS